MINKISDHLPVFVLHKNAHQKNEEETMYWSRRVKTEKTIEAFRKELLTQDWSFIYRENDTNKAYDEFVRVFQKVYDKNCPIKKIL